MATSASSRRTSSAKSTGKLTVEFSESDRETKNAFRFKEDLPKGKERGDIGSIYVLKSALEKFGIDPDNGIKVTVEELD